MGGLPDILFVIDTNKEEIAVQEANKLGIPVVAVVDSNCDPRKIRYPFPGNDDASRAINLYCDLAVAAVLDGIQAEMTAQRRRRRRHRPTSAARSRSCRARSSRLAEVEPPWRRHRRSRGRDCGACLTTELNGTKTMAEITTALIKRAARADRRRHDGLQEGAGRDRWRPRGCHRLAAQEGPGGGRQEGRPRRPREGPDRHGPRRHHGCHWSRSTPRPTSSPATRASRSWCAGSRPWHPQAKGDLEALKAMRIPEATGRTVEEEITAGDRA